MSEPLAIDRSFRPQSPIMLTGNQIRDARRKAGINTQAKLALAAGLSRPTIERAEQAREEIPDMQIAAMKKIVSALLAAGVEFELPRGESPIGGLIIRMRKAQAE